MLRRQSVLAGAACVLAACARRPAPSVGAAAAPQLAAAPGLNVQVTWNAPVDLDLYLTDPTSEAVYFANNPSRTGARLLRDTRCRDVASANGPFVETANMPDPLPGRYRVGVDFIDSCEAKDKLVAFRVVVDFSGVHQESTGTIHPDQFQPIAMEFELRRTGEDGPLRLAPPDLVGSLGLDPQPGAASSALSKEN